MGPLVCARHGLVRSDPGAQRRALRRGGGRPPRAARRARRLPELHLHGHRLRNGRGGGRQAVPKGGGGRDRLEGAQIRRGAEGLGMAIFSDVSELSCAGLATRTRGALLPHDFSLVEPPYPRKSEKAMTAKARLGRAAAALIPEMGTVFVDAGPTCLEVGRALLDRPALRIFTNSVPLLALASEARATVSAVGGEGQIGRASCRE